MKKKNVIQRTIIIAIDELPRIEDDAQRITHDSPYASEFHTTC